METRALGLVQDTNPPYRPLIERVETIFLTLAVHHHFMHAAVDVIRWVAKFPLLGVTTEDLRPYKESKNETERRGAWPTIGVRFFGTNC